VRDFSGCKPGEIPISILTAEKIHALNICISTVTMETSILTSEKIAPTLAAKST
jgi:hypothetical protein